MDKKIINTKLAPEPIGPYSQAVQVGNTIFTSGQIALNPVTGQLVVQDIESETRMVLENVKAVLAEGGFELKHVVKCSVFIMNMEQFDQINKVYSGYFNLSKPARETVQVACLPKNVNIEISVIASK